MERSRKGRRRRERRKKVSKQHQLAVSKLLNYFLWSVSDLIHHTWFLEVDKVLQFSTVQ